jgi:hypothetical protein
MPTPGWFLLLVVVRCRLDRTADQLRARVLFGRLFSVIHGAGSTVYLAYHHVHPPELSGGAVLVLPTIIRLLCPILLRYSALSREHVIYVLVAAMVHVVCMPPISTLGKPIEGACFGGALVLGSVCGVGVELLLRRGFLTSVMSTPAGTRKAADARTTSPRSSENHHPWLLKFKDDALEAQYTSERFRAAGAPFFALVVRLRI